MLGCKMSALVRVIVLLSLCLGALPAISAEPTSVKGLVLWLSADDIDGDGVADESASATRAPRWVDKSGLGNHLKQPSAERQPRLLDLRGDDFKKKEPQRGFWVGYQNNGRNRLGIAHGDEGEATSVAWNGKPNLLEVIYEGRGRWAQYLNGKLGGRGTFGNRTFLGFRKPIRLAIGQHAGITSANTFYRGDLAEVLLYNRAPAPDERNALGDYLSRKYGIETTYGPLPRFEKDVAPILAWHCQKCHAQRSYFLEMIDSGEMPPEGEKRLAKEDVALLRRWVQLGAPTDERIVLTKTADYYDANPKTRTASSELTEAWRSRRRRDLS